MERAHPVSASHHSHANSMNLTTHETQLVLGALDSLGVALADHDHQWSDGERAIYEEARKVLGAKDPEIPSVDDGQDSDDGSFNSKTDF